MNCAAALNGLLETGDATANICQLEKFEFQRALPHTTKSDTALTFAKLSFDFQDKEYAMDVALKISLVGKHLELDNSTEIEAEIYKKVVNNLLMNHFTPCLIGCISADVCRDYTTPSEDPVFQQIKLQIQKLGRNLAILGHDPLPSEILQIIVLEKINAKSLAKTWGDIFSNTAQRLIMSKSIAFQILYSLLVFQQVGLRHNDLHDGNLLVEKMIYRDKPPVDIFFADEDTYYVVPCFFRVRIYDFDDSWVTGVENRKLSHGGVHSYCNNYGMCNSPNTKYDAYMFLYTLYSEGSAYIPEIARFCFQAADARLYHDKYLKPGRLCKLVVKSEKDTVCAGNWEPNDTVVKKVDDMLKLSFFTTFRKTLKRDGFDRQYAPRDVMDFAFGKIYTLPSVDREKLLANIKQSRHVKF